MIVGRFTKGTTPTTLAADTKVIVRYPFTAQTRLPKLTVWLDGLGSGSATAIQQVMRGIIYDSADKLVAQGVEIVVASGQAGKWVDLPFTNIPGGVLLQATDFYGIGFHAGPSTNVIRVYA
jgi:hypothetical protein